jgi:hypothetical protein
MEAGSGQQAAGSEDEADLSLPSAICPLPALFEWHLTDIQRAKKLRKPNGHPQPVWFTPFD